MLIFYVRHGDPIYDPDQLTPLGEEQAKAVAKRLALFGLDEIYSSTSNRAMLTAKPTCEALGLPLRTLDFINENYLDALKIQRSDSKMDWIWAHPVYSEIFSSRELRELGDKWYTHPALAHMELDKTVHPITQELDGFIRSHGYEHDVDKGLYRVIDRHPEKRIAIFAHECIGKIIMSHLLDIPFPSYAAHFEMHTSAISVIRLDDGTNPASRCEPCDYARARVLSLSNDAHLYREEVSLVHRFTHLREEY